MFLKFSNNVNILTYYGDYQEASMIMNNMSTITRKLWNSHTKEYKFAFNDIRQDVYIHGMNRKISLFLSKFEGHGEKLFIKIIGNIDPRKKDKFLRRKYEKGLEPILNRNNMFSPSNDVYGITKVPMEHFELINNFDTFRYLTTEIADLSHPEIIQETIRLTPKKLINLFQWSKNMISEIRIDLTTPDLEEEDLLNLARVINNAKKFQNLGIIPIMKNIPEVTYKYFEKFIKSITIRVSIKTEKKIEWKDLLFLIHSGRFENLEINDKQNDKFNLVNAGKIFYKHNGDFYLTEVDRVNFYFNDVQDTRENREQFKYKEGQIVDYESEITGLKMHNFKKAKKVDLNLFGKKITDILENLKMKQFLLTGFKEKELHSCHFFRNIQPSLKSDEKLITTFYEDEGYYKKIGYYLF